MPVALELVLARVLGQEEEHGIAEDVQDDEGEDGDAEDDDHELDELAGDVASHDGLLRSPLRPLSPAGERGPDSRPAERGRRSFAEGSALCAYFFRGGHDEHPVDLVPRRLVLDAVADAPDARAGPT